MTTIATPTTGGCDVKNSEITLTTEPTYSNTSVIVSENERPENTTAQQTEQASSITPERQHCVQSIEDKDNDRTTDYDDDKTVSDHVFDSGESPTNHESPASVNATIQDSAERCSMLSKVLENDKIGKEPASVIHIKQKDAANSGLQATVADQVPSKHNATQPLDNNDVGETVNELREGLDSKQDTGEVTDDAAVIIQVCDNDKDAKEVCTKWNFSYTL